jgi:hypothetical protein
VLLLGQLCISECVQGLASTSSFEQLLSPPKNPLTPSQKNPHIQTNPLTNENVDINHSYEVVIKPFLSVLDFILQAYARAWQRVCATMMQQQQMQWLGGGRRRAALVLLLIVFACYGALCGWECACCGWF